MDSVDDGGGSNLETLYRDSFRKRIVSGDGCLSQCLAYSGAQLRPTPGCRDIRIPLSHSPRCSAWSVCRCLAKSYTLFKAEARSPSLGLQIIQIDLVGAADRGAGCGRPGVLTPARFRRCLRAARSAANHLGRRPRVTCKQWPRLSVGFLPAAMSTVTVLSVAPSVVFATRWYVHLCLRCYFLQFVDSIGLISPSQSDQSRDDVGHLNMPAPAIGTAMP
jgi:hypothetical protein